MKKPTWRSRRFGLALGLAACGRTSEAEHVAQAPAADDQKRPEAIVVTVTPVAARSVERTVSVVGTLGANEQADLASETEGQVMAVRSDLGDRVTRGQVLLDVRSDVVEAQLRRPKPASRTPSPTRPGRRRCAPRASSRSRSTRRCRTGLRVAKARRDRLRIERRAGARPGAVRRLRFARASPTWGTTCAPARWCSGSCRTIRSSSAARSRSATCRRSSPARRCASRSIRIRAKPSPARWRGWARRPIRRRVRWRSRRRCRTTIAACDPGSSGTARWWSGMKSAPSPCRAPPSRRSRA